MSQSHLGDRIRGYCCRLPCPNWVSSFAFVAALACANGTSSTGAEPAQPAAPSTVQPDQLPLRISIRSKQAAWSATEQRIDIEQTPHGFKAGGRALEEGLVRALLRAVSAPLEPGLNAERLRPWIGDVRARIERYELLPRTAERLAARVLEPENLAEIMKRALAPQIFDQDPAIELEITWPSGDRWVFATKSRRALMLPWNLDGSITWNPDLSVAVAALMPDGAVYRNVAMGQDLTGLVVRYGHALLSPEIGSLEAEERFGKELEPLRERFRIEESRVESKPGLSPHLVDNVWCGKLWGAVDAQFGFALCLSARDGLPSVDPFLRDADALLARAGKVPWLKRFAARHANAEILIHYRDQSSLSDHARDIVLLRGQHPSDDEPTNPTDDELRQSLGITVALRGEGRSEHLDEDGYEKGTWLVLIDGRALFLDGKPHGAMEPLLKSGRLIERDGSGGVTKEEREDAARRAREQAGVEDAVRDLTSSVRAGFHQVEERANTGTLTEQEKRELSAPIRNSRVSNPSTGGKRGPSGSVAAPQR